jgi:hypothetical protein
MTFTIHKHVGGSYSIEPVAGLITHQPELV